MRRLLAAAALLASLLLCAPAGAVELENFDVTFTGPAGEEARGMAAGAHPAQMTTSFEVAEEEEGGKSYPVEAVKDLRIELPVGFTGIPVATPRCTAAEFLNVGGTGAGCAAASAVGRIVAVIGEGGEKAPVSSDVFNMQASPGFAAKLGFRLAGVYITVDLGLSESPPYRLVATLRNISQVLEFFSSELTIDGRVEPSGGGDPAAFLVNPRACEGPLPTVWETISWQQPAATPASGSVLTHDDLGPRGFSECGALPFSPSISARPTSRATTSPSGLDFSLEVDDPGLTNPAGIAAADIEKAEVRFPPGFTVNPSQAEGLEVCSEAELGRESAFTPPGAGCPAASKIGTIEVQTPLLPEELLRGQLYVAEPYANPFDSLIAVYVVISDPDLGISVIQAIEVTPDPETGQLVAIAEDIPQLPFSHFRLRFREGGRAPLITPPGCGTFETLATLHPHTGPAVQSSSQFEIVSGPANSPCPVGAAPFDPGFEAGTLSNAAGSYSPFHMRITRGDGQQDLTKFSATLPPGVLARLAGVPYCTEAGIARAQSRSGERGGEAELADPSCAAASRIGTTIGGAGVGSQLTYVPGSLYLAGPYKGAPLSVVSITPALAGPFDAGTIVVRVGLGLDPVTGEAFVDGAASDPIPHILQGIPLNVRDLRVRVDRPDFTLNATSCAERQARAQLFGGGTVLAPLPDHPVQRSARYQASSCASLGFKPRLGIKLRGGTRRGAFPALRSVVTPRPGDANFKRAVVTLPRSAFLEQGHIRTICTRVQFAAGAGHGSGCPKGAVYGRARAWSPLLAEPLSGPVFLRSSDNNLPDLVVALKGLVDIELGARIDSIRGGIRATFTGIPDAPVSRFILDMQGGRKGLIVNSRNLCAKAKRNRARANLVAQNSRRARSRPVVRAVKCGKAKRKRARASHRRR